MVDGFFQEKPAILSILSVFGDVRTTILTVVT